MKRNNIVFHINKCIDGLYRECNNNCIFCAENVDSSLSNRIFMTKQMMLKVLNDLKKHQDNVENIFFAGGEPTLRTDFTEMLHEASLFANSVHMTSNGNYNNPEKFARVFHENGLTHASFSLHGSNAEEHELATRTIGSFKKVMRTIPAFISEGINVSLNCVVTSININSLLAILKLVHETFPSVHMLTFSHYRRHGEACDHDNLMFSAIDYKLQISKAIDFCTQIGTRVFFRDFPFCIDARIKNMDLDVRDIYVVLWEDLDKYYFCSEESKKSKHDLCKECNEKRCPGFLSSVITKTDKYQAWKNCGVLDDRNYSDI